MSWDAPMQRLATTTKPQPLTMAIANTLILVVFAAAMELQKAHAIAREQLQKQAMTAQVIA